MSYQKGFKLFALLLVLFLAYSLAWVLLAPLSFDPFQAFLWVPALFFFLEFFIVRIISANSKSNDAGKWLQNSVKAIVFKILFGISVFLVIILKGPEAHRKFILFYLFGLYLLFTLTDLILLFLSQNNQGKSA